LLIVHKLEPALRDLLTAAASPFDHTGGCRILGARRSGGRFRNCYRVHTASADGWSSWLHNRRICGRFTSGV